MKTIRLLNPNSNETVTDGLRDAVAPYQVPGRAEITCATLASGPFGIESQHHVEEVALPVLADFRAHPADAYIIACYSDPGLALCRAELSAPVFGIMESGLLTALARGDRFGVVAIRTVSVKRHLRALRQIGIEARLAAERALDMSVAETASGPDTFRRLVETGTVLRDTDGADVIVLGCAGMARHRAGLEETLGLPVVDPVQAAAAMALGTALITP